jgi:hypothetical protein
MTEEQYTERVVGLVTPTTKVALLQEAKEGGVSMSTLIRTILMDRHAQMLEEIRNKPTCDNCADSGCGHRDRGWCSGWHGED